MLTMTAALADPTIKQGSPEWWLDRLSIQLNERAKEVDEYENWYAGDHPLPVVANSQTIDEAERAYRALLRSSVTNFMGLVADAPADRLNIIGFQVGDDPQAGADVWDSIWQANHLDADHPLVISSALHTGQSFMSIWPNDDDGTASVTAEDPSQTLVAYAPGSRRTRVAALKRWILDDGKWNANVYLPDAIYKFTGTGNTVAGAPRQGNWEHRQDDGDDGWPVKNPWGVVPIVEFQANPSLKPSPFGGGRPEFYSVLPIQERCNRSTFNRLITQEFQSFRQRWATGMEPAIDPESGKAINPFKPGQNNLWLSADEQVKFGEFSEADLTRVITAIEADVQQIAAITRTPLYYLSGQMVNVSGDALVAAEAGLISKVQRHQRNFGESFEEVMRIALLMTDDPRADDQSSQVLWDDPEQRSWAQTTDALVKMQTLGLPTQALWEKIPGATPTDVKRWMSMKTSDLLLKDLLAPRTVARETVAVPDGGPPPAVTPDPNAPPA